MKQFKLNLAQLFLSMFVAINEKKRHRLVCVSTQSGMAIIPIFLYLRHMKYVGVYSFRFSVCPFVRTYVRLFVRLSVTGSKFLR